MRRFLSAALCAFFLFSLLPARAETASPSQFRGHQPGQGYQYVLFGVYPTDEDGNMAPVLWRVLGAENGTLCLMTEAIIDFLDFHDVKDTDPDAPLDYADSLLNKTCNDLCVNQLFSREEQACLVEMENGRGLLSAPTKKELCHTEYGFKATGAGPDPIRQARGTAYAYHKGLQTIVKTGNSWYWTTDRRRPGYRWIVGDNGHLSVSGIARGGGLRPVCYVRVDLLSIQSGSGDKADPFRLAVR